MDIADGPFGSNLKTEHYTDEKEARIIQLSNLSDYGWQEPNTRYTTFEHAKEIRRCIVNEGELVMGKMMPAGMTIIRPNTEKMYVLSSDCVRIKLDKNVAIDKFFLYTTKSEAFLNQVNNDSQGSTRVRTSISKIREMDFATPSLEEQAKIGEYFTNLDNLITLHQRECEKLLCFKKSMLEKMFPKNGEKYPEIRFSGFTDSWEQRKFSDITFPSGEKNRDNFPYESFSITNENGFVPQNDKFENGGTMRDADKRMYYIVSPQSFAYNPARINVGSIGYQNTSKNVIVSSLYEVFKTTKEVDDRFLWHWFKSANFQKLIIQLQEGGVRLYFYYDKLCMGTIALPNLTEQHKIGAYLDKLDDLITLHQREIKVQKRIKLWRII